MENDSYWRIDPLVWQNLKNKDVANLILAQGEALLKETVETSKTITAKTEKLLSLVLPLATTFLAYTISTYFTKGWEFLNILAAVALMPCCISLFYIHKNFKSYNIAVSGDFPKSLLVTDFFNNQIPDDHTYMTVLFHVYETIQSKIEINRPLNTARSNANQKALVALLFILPSPLVAFLLLHSRHLIDYVFPLLEKLAL